MQKYEFDNEFDLAQIQFLRKSTNKYLKATVSHWLIKQTGLIPRIWYFIDIAFENVKVAALT